MNLSIKKNLIPTLLSLSFFIVLSVSVFVSCSVLERWDNLFPSWMILWECVDREDLSELNDVHDLEFLELKVAIECSVVELTHEGH